jgi:hypothetical protein
MVMIHIVYTWRARTRRALLFASLFYILSGSMTAQTPTPPTFTISGTVTEKESGEELIGVTIRVAELPKKGAFSNKHGFYSLSLPQGTYTLSYNYIGHKKQTTSITLYANIKQNIELISNANSTQEVVVTADKKNNNISSPQIGVEKVDIQSIRNIPVLFGERDVLKTIQLLPGVKSAGEGNSGFSVRGGNTDQNLILLDEAPVYNASHLLGFFSTFNSDAIKDVTLYKAGMPSNYGGRVSSVLDIRMNEGNAKEFGVQGGIGLISSKLLVEGPIQEDISSFLIAGRRTYADVFLAFSSDEATKNSSLYFYDLNAKANYKLGDNDRIFLSGYFGRDVLGFNNTFGINWGNSTATLRWNHIWNSQLFSNSSLIFSNYDYNIGINFGGVDFDIYSQIQDWNFKQEFEYFSDPENTFQFGINAIHHTIVPGTITASGSVASVNARESQKQYSLEGGLYATHRWKANEELSLEYGARMSSFSVLGGSKQYTLDDNRRIVDTIDTEAGEILKTYLFVEPRVSLSYLLNETSSLKASYVRNTQGLHLLSNSTTSSPTDRWVSSNSTILPQISDQFSLGYFKNFTLSDDSDASEFEVGVETYYKDMQNQIDYKDGAQLNRTDTPETEILVGEGRAYGLEILLKKKTGRFTGWLSYTLARTERKIDNINGGDWYAFRQDRTHDLALVGMYQLNDRWSFSANFVYYTGNAVTFPSGKYETAGNVVFYYTERNGYRMPAYHRLDLGATWKLGPHSELNFSLYNAYGRENAYTIDFQKSEIDPTRTEALQTSLFRWIPSVSWNFKF